MWFSFEVEAPMQTDQWKTRMLARESFLNVLSLRSRALPLSVVALGLGVLMPLIGSAEARSLTDQLDALSLSGRNVLVFESGRPQETASIDRTSCESLSHVEGVDRAGLIRSLPRQDVIPIGRSTLFMAASTQLIPLLGTVDAVVGSALWTSSEDFRITVDGEVLSAHVNDAQPAGLDTNSAMVVGLPSTSRSGSTCIAVLDPRADSEVLLSTLPSQLTAEGSPIAGREVHPLPIDPIASYLMRATKWVPLVLGLLGGAATAMLFRLRSSEIAAYRLSGTSGRSMLVLLGFEAVLIATPEVIGGTVASLILADSFPDPLAPVLAVAASAGLWVAVAVSLSAFAVRQSPLSLAKDR